MYGTVARTRVTPENRPKLRELFERQLQGRRAAGYIGAYMLFENDSDTAWLIAMFEDRETYEANAGDPAQDAEYREYRALLEEDPEWHDGEIEGAS